MGVDAYYVVPYKQGLLRRMYVDVCKKQYYLQDGGSYHMVRGACNDTWFAFAIKAMPSGRIVSHVTYHPALSLLEVDDMCRYLGANNEAHHREVESYFTRILQELGASPYAHVRTCPEWCSLANASPETEGDLLRGEDVLLEIPDDLLRAREMGRLVTVFGPERLRGVGWKRTWEFTLETALAEGHLEQVKEWMERWKDGKTVGVDYTWEEVVVLACKARATNCLEYLLQQAKGRDVPLQAAETVRENLDRASMLCLLRFGWVPTEDDLFAVAQRGQKGMFLEMLSSYASSAVKK